MSQSFEPFGKYILLEKLAMGGMAEVYLGKNPGIGISKFVAIKRILPQFSENENFIEMFKGEAKIAINLAHSNIVSIHEFGVERDQFFIVMDYVEGRNLRQILNKLKKNGVSLSIEQTVFIIKEVAAGIDHAHRCLDNATGKPLNIIHRDMSPQNVMVSFEGEVKVVDFGIAKAETQIETTRAGELKGKFGYMSPEQAEGQPVDLRTDIFSLGIVLWEMLANDRLFIANNEINTLRKIRECQVPSLRKINPSIPQELERICSMALAKDRNLRYQTAASFHRELNRFMNRQYPDFSPHDFSVFVKTLFATEILESRKRQMEYAASDAKGGLAQALAQQPSSASKPAPSVGISSNHTQTRTENDEPSALVEAPDFSEAGRDDEAKRLRVEAEAKAKAKAEAEGKAKLNSATKPLSLESIAKPAVGQPPTGQTPAGQGPVGRTPLGQPPPPIQPVRNLRQDEFSLAVDTGSWHARKPVREGTFATKTNYNYTVSGRHPSSIRAAPRGGGTSFGAALVGLIALAMVGGGAWYAMDRAGFEKAKRTVVAAISGRTVHQSSQDPDVPPAEVRSVPTVKITSAPSGAQIWIDGSKWGDSTPATIELSEGLHRVRLFLPGYAEEKKEITVVAGPQQLISAQLVVERVAYLTVETDAPADIFVDGAKIGTHTTSLANAPVMAEREITVRAVSNAPPNASVERKITLQEKAQGKLRFTLMTPGAGAPPKRP